MIQSILFNNDTKNENGTTVLIIKVNLVETDH